MNVKSQSIEYQLELLEEHPRREEIEYIRDLVAERIFEVIGGLSGTELGMFASKRLTERPFMLASIVSNAVARAVAGRLASDPRWPDGPTPPLHQEEVVLTRSEVERFCRHIERATVMMRRSFQHFNFPTWPHQWVHDCLQRSWATVTNEKDDLVPHDQLDVVIIRRDGSSVTILTDGSVHDAPPLDLSAQCPVVPRRSDGWHGARPVHGG